MLHREGRATVLGAPADVNLGYLRLGQPLTTVSGGERQRNKLAIEVDRATEVIVLDGPTAGLHMDDVSRLVGLLDGLVERGRTVIVMEHDLDVVAGADWVIDMGPGAGHDGGRDLRGPPRALLDGVVMVVAGVRALRRGWASAPPRLERFTQCCAGAGSPGRSSTAARGSHRRASPAARRRRARAPPAR